MFFITFPLPILWGEISDEPHLTLKTLQTQTQVHWEEPQVLQPSELPPHSTPSSQSLCGSGLVKERKCPPSSVFSVTVSLCVSLLWLRRRKRQREHLEKQTGNPERNLREEIWPRGRTPCRCHKMEVGGKRERVGVICSHLYRMAHENIMKMCPVTQ